MPEADTDSGMNFISILEKWNKPRSIVVAFLLIGIIGLIDYYTGYELSFFLFYFIPVVLLTWKGGRWLGIFGAVLSAVVWAEVNIAAGLIYSNTLIMVWNVSARLITFVILTLLLASLRSSIVHLQAMSRTDSLTGAANTRAFLEILKTEMDRVRRYRNAMTIIYLDLDNFKGINDSLGHGEEDSVLKAVVSVIRRHIRATDVVARVGGDEFALLLPETEKEPAEKVVAKFRSAILSDADSKGWKITISAGSFTTHDASLDPDEMIRKADDLMYQAKLEGKNKAVFSP